MSRLLAAVAILLAAALPCASAPFNPSAPASSGYTKTFDDEFNSLATIDTGGTGAAGFNWYTTRFFGYATTPPANYSIGAGGLTISTGTGGENYAIATAGPSSNGQGYVGTVFSGGFYVEASISLNSAALANRTASDGWPSFWSMAVEHMAGKLADPWVGQATGYEHYIENDFFEYLNLVFSHGDAGSYSAALHDWYGVYNTTCAGYCSVQNTNPYNETPNGTRTNWTQFHTIGQLWVPANPITGNIGYVQNYFDGVPIAATTWGANQDGLGPGPTKSTFSIMDRQHLVVILGTGVSQPMTVAWVHVWTPPAIITTPKRFLRLRR